MPQIPTKNNNGQYSSSDVLSVVMKLKDDVNSALLWEHTKSADLANTLVDVEEQIREATELILKNLRADIEKKKKKIASSIRRLHDSSKRYNGV